MDKIFITGLRAETIIGINDWERKVHQPVTVDLELATDISRAAATDDIEFALNYKTLSDQLVTFSEVSEFQLVEALIEGLATIVTEEFGVPWVRITLHKVGALSKSKDVGLIIERGELAH